MDEKFQPKSKLEIVHSVNPVLEDAVKAMRALPEEQREELGRLVRHARDLQARIEKASGEERTKLEEEFESLQNTLRDMLNQ